MAELVHFDSLPFVPNILPAVNIYQLLSFCIRGVKTNEEIIYLLYFFSELAALDKKVDKVRRFLLLHAWMKSERETSRRSKRTTKSRKKAQYRLPYFPLYPIDIPGTFID